MLSAFLFIVIFSAFCFIASEAEAQAITPAATTVATVPTVKPAPRVPAQAQAITPAATTVLRVESSSLRPVQQLTCQELRPLCTEHSIKWRNLNAKNRHATATQMKAALTAKGIIGG